MLPRRPGKDTASVGFLYMDRADLDRRKLPGETRDLQVKCVCGGTHLTCNGGWMKRLEDEARPVLVPLIKGDASAIFPAHQRTIAGWAAVKSVVLEHHYEPDGFTDSAERRYLMRHRLPPDQGWGVWIGPFQRRQLKTQLQSYPFSARDDEGADLGPDEAPAKFNCNATTQIIGKLLIHVMRCPAPEVIERWRFFAPHGGSVFRIWPPVGHGIRWPGRFLDDRDAVAVMSAAPDFLLNIARNRG